MTESDNNIPPFLIDTHCHLDALPPELLLKQLSAASRVGVGIYLVPGVSPENWPRIAEIAERIEEVFPAFGLHPMYADTFTIELLDNLSRMLPQSVAVGEIGLDYTIGNIPRELQLEAFRLQLRLAVQAGLPVLIHCRKAFGDLLNVMKEEGADRVGGIMHAFSGSPEMAREFIRLGMCISIAGPVTYKNAVRPRNLVERIPLSHIVLETDAPDLSPEPYRGLKNEPAFLVRMAETVAEIKGTSYGEVAKITTENAIKILGR